MTTNKIHHGPTQASRVKRDIRSWIATWNKVPWPYVWVKTADQTP